MKEISLHQIYRHYKNKKLYTIIDIALMQDENEEYDHKEVVVYKSIEDDLVFTRLKKGFLEKVEYMGQSIDRFEYISNS
jgi:hypothetical protein